MPLLNLLLSLLFLLPGVLRSAHCFCRLMKTQTTVWNCDAEVRVRRGSERAKHQPWQSAHQGREALQLWVELMLAGTWCA